MLYLINCTERHLEEFETLTSNREGNFDNFSEQQSKLEENENFADNLRFLELSEKRTPKEKSIEIKKVYDEPRESEGFVMKKSKGNAPKRKYTKKTKTQNQKTFEDEEKGLGMKNVPLSGNRFYILDVKKNRDILFKPPKLLINGRFRNMTQPEAEFFFNSYMKNGFKKKYLSDEKSQQFLDHYREQL